MIAIMDYGVGNLFSLKSSLAHLGQEAVVTADPAVIRAADRLILPGVGAFGDAMAKLEATGLVPVLREEAAKKPLLGICLGMQLLFEKSYEYGEHAGLGFVKGEVCPLEPDLADRTLKVPQIGWNAVHILRDDPLDRWYQLGSVIAIVDALLPETLSPQAEYLLASETMNAGRVLLSRAQLAAPAQCAAAAAHLERALEAAKSSRRFAPGEILAKDWDTLTDADLAALAACGYRQASCEKLHFDEHRAFGSAYFLELGLPREQLERNIPSLFTDPACGHVLRVKGFVRGAGGWVELNATADGLTAAGIPNGQEVLIVIGEGLEKEKIEEKLKR